jgi:pilus assembly protein CpaB
MKAARLVVLSVAIAAGGVAALLAGRSEPPPATTQEPAAKIPTVDILVARSDIGLGQSISPQDIQWQAWPPEAASPNFIRKNERPDAIESLAGSIARAPFVIGEPIREAKLVKAKGSGFMAAILPSGMRAIATDISPESGVGGFILPNDHVDVILTRRDRDAEKASGTEVHTSETVLTNVRVLAIDQTVEEKNGQRVVVGKTATLELAPNQAETLTLARQLGHLSLALRSITDSNSKTPSAADDDGKPEARRGGVNMVRFGITTTMTPK